MASMVTQLNGMSDNETSRVLHALESPEYIWRTTEGLSKDTHLSEDAVAAALQQIPSGVLVTTTSKQGRLYTTRKHYYERQSFLGRFLTAATGRFK